MPTKIINLSFKKAPPSKDVQGLLHVPTGQICILLTKGKHTIIDASDWHLVADRKWHARVSKNSGRVEVATYIGSSGGQKHKFLSRFLMGVFDPAQIVDHIDCDTLNNSRSNLRICSRKENNRNRRFTGNKVGLKGVKYDHRSQHRFISRIRVDGKLIHIGVYRSAEEAHKAYCESAVKYFGEFARFK